MPSTKDVQKHLDDHPATRADVLEAEEEHVEVRRERVQPVVDDEVEGALAQLGGHRGEGGAAQLVDEGGLDALLLVEDVRVDVGRVDPRRRREVVPEGAVARAGPPAGAHGGHQLGAVRADADLEGRERAGAGAGEAVQDAGVEGVVAVVGLVGPVRVQQAGQPPGGAAAAVEVLGGRLRPLEHERRADGPRPVVAHDLEHLAHEQPGAGDQELRVELPVRAPGREVPQAVLDEGGRDHRGRLRVGAAVLALGRG
eukprot:CAMPEP_0179349972 /NCGR_PEP_ID=MMETSP0797-20121207/74516_1 /TAXON_ID=47934 /ORGANISM="Dinophysis acuminata, Strain DAEP01" /LENGTH=254 /DNA_ID=CAMNT_0021064871 /DNA_START=101 /DNA_END=862 /DNA_ORIENTATION=+